MIFHQFKQELDSFDDKPTGCAGDSTMKRIRVNGSTKVNTIVWDTGGDESYFDVTGQLISNSNAIFIVYSVDDRASFDAIEKIYKQVVKQSCKEDILVMLIGNKVDLRSKEMNLTESCQFVNFEQGKRLAEKNNWHFIEMCALNAEHVNDAYQAVLSKLLID